MFTFDDLVKLDPGSAQTLCRTSKRTSCAVALKGASEPIRQFFMSNMSTRAAKMLNDEMGAMGPVRLRDVDEAQVLLVNLAKDIAAKCEIVISKTRGEEELIVLVDGGRQRQNCCSTSISPPVASASRRSRSPSTRPSSPT